LAERFQLTVHKETKEQSIYALEIAKGGSKLQDLKEPNPNASMSVNRGRIEAKGLPVQSLAQTLSGLVARAVIDKTGLTAKYDFTLQWTPDVGTGGALIDAEEDKARAAGLTGPSLFSAIQEQLGLRLTSQKGPIENVVIDRVERPSDN
jgi:uncharacterized protein (TIGR03435 family)